MYTAEISGERFRNLSTNILFMSWGVGQLLVVNIEYYVTDWRNRLIYVIGIPLLISAVAIY